MTDKSGISGPFPIADSHPASIGFQEALALCRCQFGRFQTGVILSRDSFVVFSLSEHHTLFISEIRFLMTAYRAPFLVFVLVNNAQPRNGGPSFFAFCAQQMKPNLYLFDDTMCIVI